jgi:peptidylprolyl isomerase
MKISRLPFPASLCLASVLLAATVALSGCTTNGGVTTKPATPSPTEKGTMTSEPTAINFPTVNGSLGSAPVIVKPKDAPPAGLEIKDLVVGTGASVVPGATITAHYVLMGWSNGAIIDSSWSRGTPLTISLNQVIPGWQQGMVGMKVGGRRELLIPPALGYGAAGSGPVAPNETLIFVVDLTATK